MLARCLKTRKSHPVQKVVDLTVSLYSVELIEKWESWFTSWTQALKTGPHKNFY